LKLRLRTASSRDRRESRDRPIGLGKPARVEGKPRQWLYTHNYDLNRCFVNMAVKLDVDSVAGQDVCPCSCVNKGWRVNTGDNRLARRQLDGHQMGVGLYHHRGILYIIHSLLLISMARKGIFIQLLILGACGLAQDHQVSFTSNRCPLSSIRSPAGQ
jgi:hypothetical protein